MYMCESIQIVRAFIERQKLSADAEKCQEDNQELKCFLQKTLCSGHRYKYTLICIIYLYAHYNIYLYIHVHVGTRLQLTLGVDTRFWGKL